VGKRTRNRQKTPSPEIQNEKKQGGTGWFSPAFFIELKNRFCHGGYILNVGAPLGAINRG
jgi:hypothetical protein